ncbi:MAG TPA: ATP-binding protein [Sphingomonas sp.]|uniref:ATP-binding protein n=1 Tax=Sphingomonas sp. TaxID=28214 RepID=UPI002EDB062E
MFEYLHHLLAERGMAPHGYCLLWDPALIWTHVVSDALIGISYFSIPIVLARFLTRRRDVQFGWVVWMFAIFIMACGATHFIAIVTLWVPAYGIEALVKLVTAAASVITAVALWPLLPRAIALPSPAQLQRANAELRDRIAERDAALAALEQESQERRNAEAMLRQAQKMEAVGQLTSGIAHDFNNLLTIVIGNLDRANRLAPDHDRLSHAIRNATEGAERAARLTDQLLSFARKQPLLPGHHDLNAIVGGMQALLERALGKQVVLRLERAPDPVPVLVDRNQTESAIINLAINARDAMPDGGVITIATGVQPDEHGVPAAVITVRDTGIGIPPEHLERVFEPFFTTKVLGQGTGLGLSQVYGFAKQSQGDISIHSVPGSGTEVMLYLPMDGDVKGRDT